LFWAYLCTIGLYLKRTARLLTNLGRGILVSYYSAKRPFVVHGHTLLLQNSTDNDSDDAQLRVY